MLKLARLRSFVKEYDKKRVSDTHHEKYVRYLALLLDGKPLLPEAKDHELKDKYLGYREFHLGGDLLVIYKIDDKSLSLARIGIHSELFE